MTPETEARETYNRAYARLGAFLESLESVPGRRRALGALTECVEAFAAWERARLAAGVPESALRSLNAAFWRWVPACMGAIQAGASMPPPPTHNAGG